VYLSRNAFSVLLTNNYEVSVLRRITLSAVFAISVGVALPVYADTFRCAGHIIEDGMSRDEVLEYCGTPAEENHQVVNTWTYARDSGQLSVVVYFYANGNVEKIESVQN
jgi:hypothetical protein